MRIYVAGPLTIGDFWNNVRRGIDAGDAISAKHHTVFIPHLLCYWGDAYEHDYEFWMTQDFEWLKVCDALYRIAGDSAGADREVAMAHELGIPVYYDIDEIPDVVQSKILRVDVLDES